MLKWVFTSGKIFTWQISTISSWLILMIQLQVWETQVLIKVVILLLNSILFGLKNTSTPSLRISILIKKELTLEFAALNLSLKSCLSHQKKWSVKKLFLYLWKLFQMKSITSKSVSQWFSDNKENILPTMFGRVNCSSLYKI